MKIEKGPGGCDAEASNSCSPDQQNIETIAQISSPRKAARYGAWPAEWAHFQKMGHTADLLPYMANPKAVIAPYSTLKKLGKTPAVYNSSGQVHGLLAWQKHIATDADVKRWEAVSDYGICLQGRRVRAWDIDVPDPAKAQAIADAITGLGGALPVRSRPDSGKILLACEARGDWFKDVLQVDGGKVEFLAEGQQFLVCGRHEDGARYIWDGPGGLPAEFPVWTRETVLAVKDALELVFDTGAGWTLGGGEGRRRQSAEDLDVEDEVAVWLVENWPTHGVQGEKLFVNCPWKDPGDDWPGHSGDSGVTETAWLLRGTKGYERGHFKCLHANCEKKGRNEFLAAVGYEMAGFDDLGSLPDADDGPDPVDLWSRPEPPDLPKGLLPDLIESFSRIQAEIMGVDPGGLAMAALAVCAAAIPDEVRLQVKEHDPNWRERACLWVGLIGQPSTKKTPMIATAVRPLRKIDARLQREHAPAVAAFKKLSAEERKTQDAPVTPQLIIEDTTVEAAAVVMSESPDGVLCVQDELSGWFGSMDKYGGAKGGTKDRAFWLQTFNGGPSTVNRISRGTLHVANLSISLLGGIQPDAIRRAVAEAVDDGLIQRLNPIVLRPAAPGKDVPMPDVVSAYEGLIERLRCVKLCLFDADVLRFAPGAQDVQRRLASLHHDLLHVEAINPKLASHFGKYDGFFARLCVVWHCIENSEADGLPPLISQDTAERVAAFLHRFLRLHALAFYGALLGLSDEHETLQDVGGHILAHPEKGVITNRDLQRATRKTKALDRDGAKKVFERMEAMGWLDPVPQQYSNALPKWRVNSAVHTLFAERARAEAARRVEVRRVIAGLPEGG